MSHKVSFDLLKADIVKFRSPISTDDSKIHT